MTTHHKNSEQEKPEILYHGSPRNDLAIIEPRARTVRDPHEGPVVFASPDKAFVTKFLVPSGDSWALKGRYGSTHYHVISDRERYEEADEGGTIYSLDPEAFRCDETKNGGADEWTSPTAVIPSDRETYDSGLQAQLDSGVQVFFVDESTFDAIKQSDDHGNEIVRSLTSENERLGINPLPIPETTRE